MLMWLFDALFANSDSGSRQVKSSRPADDLFWRKSYPLGDSDVINALQHGADPNSVTPGGQTILSYAIENHLPFRAVYALLGSGADLNACISDDSTVTNFQQFLECSEKFFEAQNKEYAELGLYDCPQIDAFLELLVFMIKKGGSKSALRDYPVTAMRLYSGGRDKKLDWYFSEEEHKSLGNPDNIKIDGISILSKAVDMQDSRLVRGLCEAGADPNAPADSFGDYTVFHKALAIAQGKKKFQPAHIAAILLKHGGSVEVLKHYPDVIKLLKEHDFQEITFQEICELLDTGR